jgi:RHS repeat-associated protein
MTSMTKNYLDPSNSPGSKLNELIQTVGGMPAKYTYKNNRLASISGAQSFSLEYNPNGDATYMSDGGLEYTLGYDRLHNLTSFKHKGAPLAEFSYDGDGLRKIKTSAPGKVVYHYDAGGRFLSETGINGNLISDYVYANGKLVAKRSPTAVYFYHTDPAGTPLAMTDSAGNLVWRGDYLPFGEENLIIATEQNDYKFVGKELDKETGLYYFGARYMEATIGRFISPDSIGAVDPETGRTNRVIIGDPQRLNFYAYGLNNPFKYIDYDGNFSIRAIAYGQKGYLFHLTFKTVSPSIPAPEGSLAKWLKKFYERTKVAGEVAQYVVGGAPVSYTQEGMGIIQSIKEPLTDVVFREALDDKQKELIASGRPLKEEELLPILQKFSQEEEYKEMNYPSPQEMIDKAKNNLDSSILIGGIKGRNWFPQRFDVPE